MSTRVGIGAHTPGHAARLGIGLHLMSSGMYLMRISTSRLFLRSSTLEQILVCRRFIQARVLHPVPFCSGQYSESSQRASSSVWCTPELIPHAVVSCAWTQECSDFCGDTITRMETDLGWSIFASPAQMDAEQKYPILHQSFTASDFDTERNYSILRREASLARPQILRRDPSLARPLDRDIFDIQNFN